MPDFLGIGLYFDWREKVLLITDLVHPRPKRDLSRHYPYHCPHPHCPKQKGACKREFCQQLLEIRDKEQVKELRESLKRPDLDKERNELVEHVRANWPDLLEGSSKYEIDTLSYDCNTVDELIPYGMCCDSCNVEYLRQFLAAQDAWYALLQEKIKTLKQYIKLREEGEEAEKTCTEPQTADVTFSERRWQSGPPLAPIGTHRKKGGCDLKAKHQLNAAGANKQSRL